MVGLLSFYILKTWFDLMYSRLRPFLVAVSSSGQLLPRTAWPSAEAAPRELLAASAGRGGRSHGWGALHSSAGASKSWLETALESCFPLPSVFIPALLHGLPV